MVKGERSGESYATLCQHRVVFLSCIAKTEKKCALSTLDMTILLLLSLHQRDPDSNCCSTTAKDTAIYLFIAPFRSWSTENVFVPVGKQTHTSDVFLFNHRTSYAEIYIKINFSKSRLYAPKFIFSTIKDTHTHTDTHLAATC